jgi:hypothetical protein
LFSYVCICESASPFVCICDSACPFYIQYLWQYLSILSTVLWQCLSVLSTLFVTVPVRFVYSICDSACPFCLQYLWQCLSILSTVFVTVMVLLVDSCHGLMIQI